MATHFSILAWRISWTDKPGRLLYCVSLYIYIYIYIYIYKIQYCKSTILQFKKSLFKNSVTQKKKRLLWCPGAKTPCSQCEAHAFDAWSGNQIPHATAKSSCATVKDPATCD